MLEIRERFTPTTQRLLASISPLELQAIHGHAHTFDLNPLKRSVLIRWRVSSASTGPPGVTRLFLGMLAGAVLRTWRRGQLEPLERLSSQIEQVGAVRVAE